MSEFVKLEQIDKVADIIRTKIKQKPRVAVILGSGLGWVLFLFGQTYWLGAFPVDFKMPEAHLFFSAMTLPAAPP